MARLTLYQVAILWHPDPTKDDEKNLSTIVLVEPYFELAKDDKALAYKVVRKIDDKYIDQMNQIELLIRPF
jgi:hypothetical protein